MATIKKEITKKELVKKQSFKKKSGKTVTKKQTLTNEKKKLSKEQISKGDSNLKSTKKQTKKVGKASTPKKIKAKKNSSTKEKVVLEVTVPKEEKRIIEIELKDSKEEKKKSFFSIFSKFALPIFVIIGGVMLGIFLYTPIDTIASNSSDLNCTYGDWKEESVSFCLISPDGKYFSNDSVIYEYNEDTGMCIKKTRTKTCHY